MSTAWIDQSGAHVRLRSEHLEVVPPEEEAGASGRVSIPLNELERLSLTEHVQITSQALAALLRRGIPVHLLDGLGRELGSFLPPDRPDGSVRLRQYGRNLDPVWSLVQARAIVLAKVHNQRRLLQKLRANRPRPVDEAIAALARAEAVADRAETLDELRGAEGAASAAYFPGWAAFLPDNFPFDRRSTRPPRNAVNACLSFGYTLLYQEMVTALHTCGLDPALGCLHVAEPHRWSLALDLMEPFRPALVDALTIRLFAHRLLHEEDFEPHEEGVYLSGSGRKICLGQWESRLEREFHSEHAGHRTTLRQQLREAVAQWKRTVLSEQTDGGHVCNPYRLN